MSGNREIVVRALPDGALGEEHFELRAGAVPEIDAGQALIRTILISIDAAPARGCRAPPTARR